MIDFLFNHKMRLEVSFILINCIDVLPTLTLQAASRHCTPLPTAHRHVGRQLGVCATATSAQRAGLQV